MANDDHGNLGGTWANPYELFAFDNDDNVDDDELHTWSNITNWESLSKVNVHSTTPRTVIPIMPTTVISNVTTTTIINVLVDLEPSVHVDFIIEFNMLILKRMAANMDEVQPFTSYIHASSDDVPLSMLLTPSRQPLETTPPIHFHTMNARPSLLPSRPLHLVVGRATDSNLESTLVQHIAQRAPTIPRMGVRLVNATINMHAPSPP